MDPHTLALYAALAAAGVGAGFINTLAGGGSMLTLSALMLLGLPADLANGTNRLSVVTQSVSGVVGFARRGKLPSGSIAQILAPTVVGAVIGAMTASRLPERVLELVLLGTMAVVAALMALFPGAAFAPDGEASRVRERRVVGTAALVLAGFYGGFVQAGVGFVLLAVLGGVYRIDLLRANALKLLCVAVFGAAALAVFAAAGQVVWGPAALLAASSVAGSLAAVRFALAVPQGVIRWIVFAGVVATGVAALARG